MREALDNGRETLKILLDHSAGNYFSLYKTNVTEKGTK